MKWPPWLKPKHNSKPVSKVSPTLCPQCGDEMAFVEKNTMSGTDWRTYHCVRCNKEHDLDFGTALWKIMSDANKDDK